MPVGPTPLDAYMAATRLLYRLRRLPGHADKVEDRFSDLLDVLWEQMAPDERAEAEKRVRAIPQEEKT